MAGRYVSPNSLFVAHLVDCLEQPVLTSLPWESYHGPLFGIAKSLTQLTRGPTGEIQTHDFVSIREERTALWPLS